MTMSQEVIDKLDVKIFLRVPHDVLKLRRHERHGYHTAGERYYVDCTSSASRSACSLPPPLVRSCALLVS